MEARSLKTDLIMRLIPFIAILLLTNSLLAQPKAVIDAPDRIASGNLLILDGSKSTGDVFRWILPSQNQGFLEACDVRKVGLSLVVTRDTEFTFYLIAVDKTPAIDYATKVITVTAGPIQPPPVDPPPLPVPGDFAALVAKHLLLVAAMNDPPTASAIDKGLEAVLARPPPTDLTIARNSVSLAVETALLARTGASRAKDWLNGWRIPIATELETLAASGKFPTVEAYFSAIRAMTEAMQ